MSRLSQSYAPSSDQTVTARTIRTGFVARPLGLPPNVREPAHLLLSRCAEVRLGNRDRQAVASRRSGMSGSHNQFRSRGTEWAIKTTQCRGREQPRSRFGLPASCPEAPGLQGIALRWDSADTPGRPGLGPLLLTRTVFARLERKAEPVAARFLSGLPVSPSLLCPRSHGVVFVFPCRVHRADDSRDRPGIRFPFSDNRAIVVAVVVSG